MKRFGLKIGRSAFIALLLLIACKHSTIPQFPPDIGDLKLTKVVSLDDALKEVDRIHGRKIELEKAVIAYYQGKYGQAVIWWAQSATESLAQDQMKKMIEKINTTKTTPYSNYKKFSWNGLTIHSYLGKGQAHYTYLDGKETYWISANPMVIDTILHTIMK